MIMEHVKNAINFAELEQATDFKSSILAALQDKVQDALHLKRMEIGANLISDNEEDSEEEHNTEQSSEEENVDENL